MNFDLTKGAVRAGLSEAKTALPKALAEGQFAEELSSPGGRISTAQAAEAYVAFVYALRSVLRENGIEYLQDEGPEALASKAIYKLDQASDIGDLTGDYSQLESQAALIDGVKNTSLEHRKRIAELTSGVSLLQGLERFEKDDLLKAFQFDDASYQTAAELGQLPMPLVSSPNGISAVLKMIEQENLGLFLRVLGFDHLAVQINTPGDERKTIVYSIPPNRPASGLTYAIYKLDGQLEEFIPSPEGLNESSGQLKEVLIAAYRNMAEGKLDEILGEGVFSKVWKTFDPLEALDKLEEDGKLDELRALPPEKRPIIPTNIELKQYTAESLLYGLGYRGRPLSTRILFTKKCAARVADQNP
jgi:hypothetical protein